MRQPHPAQHVWRFGELDVVVADDLNPVAPWIAEIKEPPRQHLDPRVSQGFAHGFLVVHDKSEMTALIRRLPATLLQSEELIAKINERRVLALAAQFEVEQAAVERQRLV